jgi:ubiquinone/menaquinone biosynthesis C-methylase UbiE
LGYANIDKEMLKPMDNQNSPEKNGWSEETWRVFAEYGQYIVPHRLIQLKIISALLVGLEDDARIIDLCCGDGLLAEMLLDSKKAAIVYGLDGSVEMLRRATGRLSRFGSRFVPKMIELSDQAWRSSGEPVDALVSSMAIHHLDGPQKQVLFADIHRMLKKNGTIVIADITDPVSEPGRLLAADMWDESVKDCSMEMDGNTGVYDFFRREEWNIFRYPDPEDIDKPSPLYDQLRWLEKAGFVEIEVHWMLAGHAIFSARK